MLQILKKIIKLLLAIGFVYLVWAFLWCYGQTGGGVCHYGPLSFDTSWLNSIYKPGE